MGSSPRVWGQGHRHFIKSECIRIIPTRVGTSRQSAYQDDKARDHPHACGDKSLGSSNEYRYEGSSPRVWGQAATAAAPQDSDRIIPTRVGTSCKANCGKSAPRDHPHACGDKCHSRRERRNRQGSSPRVWGQVLLLCLI